MGENMEMIQYGLKAKVFVVTGSSRGIGLEIAKELLSQGAKVVISARKSQGLDDAVAELGGGNNLLAVNAHVAKSEEVDRLFAAAVEKFARVDVLINNVGMNLITPSVVQAGEDLWQKIMDTNLNGAFLCSRAAAKIMTEQRSGRIVSISSIAGTKASPGMGIYGVAKAGIEMLTRVLAAELAPYVTVNAVAPGMVRTEFSRPFWSNQDIYDEIIRTIPAKRIAEPMDVVHPVLFLSSDAAGFITGQTLVVDGGATVV